MIVQKAGGSVMAKDDLLKKPKKIEVNRIMIFISSILIPFLWIDLYLVSKNTSKLMVVNVLTSCPNLQ